MTFNRDDIVFYQPKVGGRKKRAAVVKDEGGDRVLIVTDFGETIDALRSKLTLPKVDPLAAFESWALQMPRAELGGLIKEYFAESNHNGWDCWDRRDLTGIRKWCEDVMRYHHHSDATELATEINNVNPVP